MPATKLRRIQIGKQSTWGTPVAATALLRGLTDGSITYKSGSKVFADELGIISGAYTAYKGPVASEGNIKYLASYEDILYALHGLFGSVTPTGSGPYVWTYSAPITALATPQVYTLEYGTTGAEYRLQDALISSLTISGEVGEDPEVEIECDLLGTLISAQAMTTSLPVRVVNPVLMNHAALYIDAWGGTMGTTAVTASLIKFELSIDPSRHLKQFDGNSPAAFGDDGWESTLTLTLEYNSTVKALVDALLSGLVQRQIELRFTSGTNVLRLQFAGTLTGEPELFGDRDGNMTVELEFEPTYNTGFANWFKAIVTNGVQTLP